MYIHTYVGLFRMWNQFLIVFMDRSYPSLVLGNWGFNDLATWTIRPEVNRSINGNPLLTLWTVQDINDFTRTVVCLLIDYARVALFCQKTVDLILIFFSGDHRSYRSDCEEGPGGAPGPPRSPRSPQLRQSSPFPVESTNRRLHYGATQDRLRPVNGIV